MDHPKSSHLQRLLSVRAEHAGRLGAVHGLLPSDDLGRLDELSEAELERLDLAALKLDADGQVVRSNQAAARLYERRRRARLAEDDSSDARPLVGRRFFSDICPSANGPLFRGLVDSTEALHHLVPYSFIGPEGRLDALVHLHRPSGAAGCWILTRPR